MCIVISGYMLIAAWCQLKLTFNSRSNLFPRRRRREKTVSFTFTQLSSHSYQSEQKSQKKVNPEAYVSMKQSKTNVNNKHFRLTTHSRRENRFKVREDWTINSGHRRKYGEAFQRFNLQTKALCYVAIELGRDAVGLKKKHWNCDINKSFAITAKADFSFFFWQFSIRPTKGA